MGQCVELEYLYTGMIESKICCMYSNQKQGSGYPIIEFSYEQITRIFWEHWSLKMRATCVNIAVRNSHECDSHHIFVAYNQQLIFSKLCKFTSKKFDCRVATIPFVICMVWLCEAEYGTKHWHQQKPFSSFPSLLQK